MKNQWRTILFVLCVLTNSGFSGEYQKSLDRLRRLDRAKSDEKIISGLIAAGCSVAIYVAAVFADRAELSQTNQSLIIGGGILLSSGFLIVRGQSLEQKRFKAAHRVAATMALQDLRLLEIELLKELADICDILDLGHEDDWTIHDFSKRIQFFTEVEMVTQSPVREPFPFLPELMDKIDGVVTLVTDWLAVEKLTRFLHKERPPLNRSDLTALNRAIHALRDLN